MRVRRCDAGSLAPAEKLPNGWLRCEGRVARTGILEYTNADGTVRRELVLPDELFASTSTDTLRMKPVTLTHPSDLLCDKDVRAHEVGSVGENFRADENFLVAPMEIRDGEAVRAVEEGGTGLSCGYDCTIDPPDPALVPKWGAHDGIQRRRIYNHLACGVPLPRAGDGARVRLDAAGNALVATQQTHVYAATQQPENVMPPQIQIGTHRFDATDASASLIQQAIDRELGELRSRLDAVTGEKQKATEAHTAATKRADATLARWKADRKRIKGHFDAMKARMVACDECGGTGAIGGDGEHADAKKKKSYRSTSTARSSGEARSGNEEKAMFAAMREAGTLKNEGGSHADAAEKCEYCDGSGKVRMHDAIKAMAPAPDDDDDDSPDEDVAAVEDDLSGEPAAEEEQEKAANPAHDDPNDAKRRDGKAKRADARSAARMKRLDSLTRIVERHASDRAAVLALVAPHLDDKARMDSKGSIPEMVRCALGKMAPHLGDVSKMDAATVGMLFAAETKRASAAQPSPSAQLTQGVFPQPRVDSRADAHRKAVEAADRAMYPWKYPAEAAK